MQLGQLPLIYKNVDYGINKAIDAGDMATVARRIRHALWCQKRDALYAQGLTTLGRPRARKLHPELKGYLGKDYRRLYMRWWRKHKARKAAFEALVRSIP